MPVNKNVQRFRAGELVEVPIPDPQGKWVRWSDYEQLQSRLTQVEQERDRFSELADKRHDELWEARRQRDALAANHATYSRDVATAMRDKCVEKVTSYFQHFPCTCSGRRDPKEHFAVCPITIRAELTAILKEAVSSNGPEVHTTRTLKD